MLTAKLVWPSSLTVIANDVRMPAKPERGDYIQHKGVLYYVHGVILYTDARFANLVVKVTEA